MPELSPGENAPGDSRPEHPGVIGAGTVELAPGVVVPRSTVRASATRARGPGGQNVNKVSTRVELRVSLAELPLPAPAMERLIRLAGRQVVGLERAAAEADAPDQPSRARPVVGGELVVSSGEHRSQSRNRDACFERLRGLIVEAQRVPRTRRPTRPTAGSVRRRLEDKKQRSEAKRRRGRIDD